MAKARTRRRLSDKQRRFVAEYLVDLNACQAAIRAGYSPKTAETCGPRLLRNALVGQAIQAGQTKRLHTLDISAERILAELARIAFGDVRALYDEDGTLKPVHEWPDEVAAAVSGLEVEDPVVRQGQVVRGGVRKVKRWDKTRALEMLAKHRGLLKDRLEHTGPDGGPIPFRIERVIVDPDGA
jgi:phage terminase small subunit